MRFKAKLAPEGVSFLHDLILPLCRLSTSSHGGEGGTSWLRNGTTLRIDRDSIQLFCKGKSQENEGIACFAVLQADIFFEHRIESRDNNAIMMEVDLGQLKMALQSANEKGPSLEQRFCVLKLAKRNGIACLCLEAMSSNLVQVHHAIPVRILPQTPLSPPAVSEAKATCVVPRDFRTMAESIKGMEKGSACHVHISDAGVLSMRWDSNASSVHTSWDDTATTQNNASNCTCKVDVHKLCTALQWQQHFGSAMAELALVENEQVVVDVGLDVGSLTYYIPVNLVSDDPGEG